MAGNICLPAAAHASLSFTQSFEDFYKERVSPKNHHQRETAALGWDFKMRGTRVRQHAPVEVHEDGDACPVEEQDDAGMDESRDPLEESGCTHDDSEEDEDIDDSVLADIELFNASFKDIDRKYRVINRIGEGTFSTVYKAEDLNYDTHLNDWDLDERERNKWQSPCPKKHQRRKSRKPRYVAIKKIYVTSSPIRILNELELLHDLRNNDSVCPLITAFRHQDQVVAILPYFQHRDFREYYRDFTVGEMRHYFKSLFTALKAVHKAKILHRDIKPTNFLYNPDQARGVLVDFGLAERMETDWQECQCSWTDEDRIYRHDTSIAAEMAVQRGPNAALVYPRSDTRPSRRANRAGTRGFRAPEVLLKCTMQTTAIDIWSAGVILLTLLARRFPFFHSADDIDAILELTNILGRNKMKETAFLHGQLFETNIPSYSDKGHSFEKIILWCTNRTGRDKNGNRTAGLRNDEREAVEFLERCLECNPAKRITAEEALKHPFIANAGIGEEEEEGEMDLL